MQLGVSCVVSIALTGTASPVVKVVDAVCSTHRNTNLHSLVFIPVLRPFVLALHDSSSRDVCESNCAIRGVDMLPPSTARSEGVDLPCADKVRCVAQAMRTDWYRNDPRRRRRRCSTEVT